RGASLRKGVPHSPSVAGTNSLRDSSSCSSLRSFSSICARCSRSRSMVWASSVRRMSIMATSLGIRRTEVAHTIERLREQRAQIDEKLRKLEQELESLKEFVPATDGE